MGLCSNYGDVEHEHGGLNPIFPQTRAMMLFGSISVLY